MPMPNLLGYYLIQVSIEPFNSDINRNFSKGKDEYQK